MSSILCTGLTSSGAGLGAGSSGVSNLMRESGLSGLSGTHSLQNQLPSNLGYNSTSYSTYTNPLLTSGMTVKLKPYDDLDLVTRYGQRSGTPNSPVPPASWGLDSYGGLDGVNPAFMHTQRPLSRLGGLDLDGKLFPLIFFPYIIKIVQ